MNCHLIISVVEIFLRTFISAKCHSDYSLLLHHKWPALRRSLLSAWLAHTARAALNRAHEPVFNLQCLVWALSVLLAFFLAKEVLAGRVHLWVSFVTDHVFCAHVSTTGYDQTSLYWHQISCLRWCNVRNGPTQGVLSRLVVASRVVTTCLVIESVIMLHFIFIRKLLNFFDDVFIVGHDGLCILATWKGCLRVVYGS